MNHIRILSNQSKSIKENKIQKRYKIIENEINLFWESFFKTDLIILKKELEIFFKEQESCPFPAIAHVLPPNDISDAIQFLEILKSFEGIEFIDKQIHHIHHKRIILFHSTPPPSDIPRVFCFLTCFDPTALFNTLIQNILIILFKYGISPETDFIKKIKLLYFDQYSSFTLLFSIIKQSIFLYLLNNNNFEINNNEILNLKDYINNKIIPNNLIIKFRVQIIDLIIQLLNYFKLNPFIFSNCSNYLQLINSDLYRQLKKLINNFDLNKLNEFLLIFNDIPEIHLNNNENIETPIKTRSKRLSKLTLVENETGLSLKLDYLLKKFFVELDKDYPVLNLSSHYSFNPRKVIHECLLDIDNNCDTAIAYQLLQENEKIINATDWLNSFSMKINCEDKAIALTRFQVAISELEYLGYIDKRTRKSGCFRHNFKLG